MPKNNKSVPRNKKIRPNRKRGTKRISTTKRNPFSGLLVTGIRTLVSAMPGSTFLSPITDLLLSSIGLTNKEYNNPSATTATVEGVAFHGLTGATIVKYANILARTPNASLDTTKQRAYVNTPFTDAKLCSITITANPDNKLSDRAGRWTLLFIPFRDAKDYVTFKNTYTPLSMSRIQEMAGSVSDSCSRSLQIVFRPKPEDGFSYQFNPIDSAFGAVVVAFDDNIRTAYHEFTAEDFAPNISMKGVLKLRQPIFSAASVVGFEDITETFNYPAAIHTSTGDKHFIFTDQAFTCEKSTAYKGTCKVSGHLRTAKKETQVMSLEDMSLE